jgi:dipeptidase E
MRRILLLSNSTNHGGGFLDHAIDEVVQTIGPGRRVTFVPFALADRAGYVARFRARLAAAGVEVEALEGDLADRRRVEAASAVFVGGGNTFRLLRQLQDLGLVAPLAARVREGMPYLGASAGSNVAGPTIRTTNDMPIVEPPSFDALGLVPFQINPHYVDPDPGSTHMGETREQRLREYLEENDRVVVGIREGAWIEVEGSHGRLGGGRGARIFRRDAEPEERAPGAALDDLLTGA